MIQFFYRQHIIQQIILLIILIILSVFAYLNGNYVDLNTIKSIRIAQSMQEGFLLLRDLKTDISPSYILLIKSINSLGISLVFISFLGLVFNLANMVLFYLILEKNDIFDLRTSLSVFVACLAILLDKDLFILKPESIGLFFGIFGISILIDHFKTLVDDYKRHKMGFFLGLASLFHQSFVLILILIIIYLAVSSRISLRSYLLIITSFLIPYIPLLAYFIFNNAENDYFKHLFNFDLNNGLENNFMSQNFHWFGFLALGFLSFLGMSRLFVNNLQSSFKIFMFLWLIVFTCVKIFLDEEISLMILLPPLMFLFPFFMFSIKKSWFKEVIGVILVCLSIYFFITHHHHDKKQIAKKFKPKSEKWMVLSDDYSIYVEKKSASPFFDFQELLKIANKKNDYFALGLWHHYILTFKPKVIYDPNNYLKAVENYLPLLDKHYSYNQHSNSYIHKDD
ncbi:MAG: hypothetical protein SNJ77_00970 [Cytophagales bacterium]